MKKVISCAVLIMTLIVFSTSTYAEQTEVQTVARDAIWGGIVGTLIGGAVLALKDNPEDHLNYLIKGAAVGVIAGTLYGLFNIATRPSFASMDKGRITFGVPMINVNPVRTRGGGILKAEPLKGARDMVYSVNLFTSSF